MLTKAQLIDSVIQLNPTGRREWLGQFSTDEVRIYLERLRFMLEPRSSQSAWERTRSEIPSALTADADRRAA